jgi:hypothetical protein
VLEYWSSGVLVKTPTPVRGHLFSLVLLNRFNFVLIADLASIPHSGRNPEFGQNVSLKRNPNDNEQNKPQDSHIFSLRGFLFHKPTHEASSSARPLSMTSGKAAVRSAGVRTRTRAFTRS